MEGKQRVQRDTNRHGGSDGYKGLIKDTKGNKEAW